MNKFLLSIAFVIGFINISSSVKPMFSLYNQENQKKFFENICREIMHLEKGLKNRLNRTLFHFGLLAEELSGGKTFDETIFRKKLIEKEIDQGISLFRVSLDKEKSKSLVTEILEEMGIK